MYKYKCIQIHVRNQAHAETDLNPLAKHLIQKQNKSIKPCTDFISPDCKLSLDLSCFKTELAGNLAPALQNSCN